MRLNFIACLIRLISQDSKMSFLTEDISEYVKGINTLDDMKTYPGGRILYQRTASGVSLSDTKAVRDVLSNIRRCGLSREFGGTNGEAYGEGLYTSLTLPMCQGNSSGYGHIILKLWVPGFSRCLIDPGFRGFGEDLAVAVHGKDAPFQLQIQKLFKPEYANKYKDCRSVRQICGYGDGIFQENDIDGIIYHWLNQQNGEHWACVWKDYKRVFPLAYSLDYGKTFHPLGDEETLDITLKTWEPSRLLGADIHKYKNAKEARVVNGFMRLEFNEGGYNFIDPQKGRNVTSAVNFTKATDADENGVAEVLYNGKRFFYHIPTDTIYEYDSEMDSETLIEVGEDYDMLLGTSKDLPSIASRGNMAMEENIIKVKDLIKEDLDEYIPGADRSTIRDRSKNGLVTFYRLSLPDQVKSIAANGFTKEFRGSGRDNTDWLGSGTYGTINSHRRVSGKYGNILWAYGTPASLVATTYITPHDMYLSRFGIKDRFPQQLERFFPELVEKWKGDGRWNRILGMYKSCNTYNSDRKQYGMTGSQLIRAMNDLVFNGDGGWSDHYYHSHGVNGIIYIGGNDGEAVLTFDDSTIIPLAWRNNAKPDSEWNQVEITDNLWNRTFNGYDPLAFLKGTYRDYSNDPNEISRTYRVINGYMRVRRKDSGKYNYVKAPEGGRTFASKTWFDNATDLDENQVGTIKFNGKLFYYHAPTDTIYEYDSEMDSETLIEVGEDYDMLLGTSKDLPSLTMKPAMEETKGVFGDLLNETLNK